MHRKKLNASQLKEYLPIPALANWKAICIERDYKKKKVRGGLFNYVSQQNVFRYYKGLLLYRTKS